MRVQLGRAGHDESGAIAVIVALLTVSLLGIAAFTTDFGLAYGTKRQLQTASDAASLAAAQTLAGYPGNCSQIASNGAATAAAQVVATQYRLSNSPASKASPITVNCSADGKTVLVTADATESSPRLLGAIFGSGDYSLGRQATASVSVATTGVGLRPYAVCNKDLPPKDASGAYTTPSGVFKLDFTNSLCQKPSGNWWQIDCPEEVDKGTNGGNSQLAEQTLRGCKDPISIVPNQPTTDPALTAALVAACAPGPSDDCLSGDSGNDFNSRNVLDAWDYLIGKSITLPVFYTGSVAGSGTGTTYPVYRLAGVRICGYHWGKNSYGPSTIPTTGPCTGANASIGTNADNYILVNWTRVIVTGNTGAPGCSGGLGSDCDLGVRRILLVE